MDTQLDCVIVGYYEQPVDDLLDSARQVRDHSGGYQHLLANTDDEVFDLAARSGCTGVFLGIESGDNRMLKEMHKTATVEKYRYGIAKLREHGIFGGLDVDLPLATGELERRLIDALRPPQRPSASPDVPAGVAAA